MEEKNKDIEQGEVLPSFVYRDGMRFIMREL